MKEEELKNIMSKSMVETSDDFIHNLMQTIDQTEKVKKVSFWWSYQTVLGGCIVLVGIITLILYKYLNNLFSISLDIPKTPIFLIITFLLLYYVNSVIRLQENNTGFKNR